MNRAEALATEFERVNRELVECLSGLDARQWLTPGVNSPILQVGDEDEHRPVGTIAHHVASAYERSVTNLRLMADGQPVPRPQPGSAARHAAENAEPDQAATIALLDERGARLAEVVRGLTDAELDRETTTFMGTTTVAGFVERAVIFHPVWHLSSIRAALDGAGQPG
jgi:hypothetical protein